MTAEVERENMKKIYIGKTALKAQRNGCKHPKRSSIHDHKEDLRKRLTYTTHKLEMVESEFDSTRQYLETELRRAQEELDKFTDKLRRIQSSYSTLQRVNQDLEDKMHRTSQHHEEEKRALGREINVLNSHLMEAKLTIDKLRDDNDLYRKDCNLAVQLLQCSKSPYRALSELPEDFQQRVSAHIEKHGHGVATAMCHSPYSQVVPAALIAQVLEKPGEAGSSCPATRSPSPAPQDAAHFLPNSAGTGSSDQLNRRAAYKTSDLYCSDTALYCPERWQERRQSADVHGGGVGGGGLQLQLHPQLSVSDSNPDVEALLLTAAGLPPQPHGHAPPRPRPFQASSSYSSFSAASDGEKGEGGDPLGSTLSSSHQALYMDWRDDDDDDDCSYDKDATFCSYDKDSFPKSLSFQNVGPPPSPLGSGVAVVTPPYARTASCFSEPYRHPSPSPSPSPRLPTSRSMGAASDRASPLVLAPERGRHGNGGGVEVSEDDDELATRWRQLSVDELNSFSSRGRPELARSVGSGSGAGGGGRASSPYSFSERHFALGGGAKAKHGPLYSSFQEGGDRDRHSVFLGFAASPSHSPSSPRSPKLRAAGRGKQEMAPLYRGEPDVEDSDRGLFLLGGGAEETEGRAGKEYADAGRDGSPRSLQPGYPEAAAASYQRERPASRVRPNSSPRLGSGPRPSSSHNNNNNPPHRPSSSHNKPRPSSSHTPRPSSSLGPALPKKTSPRYQKFGSAGLTRKDSLTKAQLYGTLLN